MNLLSKLRKLRQAEDVIPVGFKTCDEWAKHWRVTVQHAGKLLRSGVAARLVEVKKFRRLVPNRGAIPVLHFAEKRGK